MFLAGFAALFAAYVVYQLFGTIGERLLQTDLAIPGMILGAAAGAVLYFIVLYTMYHLPFAQVVKLGLIPLVITVVAGAATGAGMYFPAKPIRERQVRQQRASEALGRGVFPAIRRFNNTFGRPPEDLKELVERDMLTMDFIVSPAREDEGDKVGYFYLPPETLSPAQGEQRPMVADWRSNWDDHGRWVLFTDGTVRWFDADAFQRFLNRDENQRFAEALRKAEGG
jgi:hypothetical protein